MDIRYEVVDRDPTPLGELVLRRYVADSGESGFEILLGDAFLMASHGSHSEREMARLAHRRLGVPPRGLHALVGGLGAGHTLRATLDLPGVDRVTVAEIGARVEHWNRTFFAEANGHAVDDPRVRVVVGDVLELVSAHVDRWHLILLDVDNGPGWLAAPGNAALYDRAGLGACRRALAPGGVLAVWSPSPNHGLRRGLDRLFDLTEEVRTTDVARAEGEPASVVYLAVTETPSTGAP